MALSQVGLERLNTATTNKIGERKNKIINGGMLVNQRGNQSSVTTSVYGLDRFKVQEAAAVTYDINQSTDTPNGFGNSFHIDIQGANSSPAASHYMQLITPLEGLDVQDFAKGTSEAKQYAVSFYIKTNVTGSYALQITDDNSRSCSQLYTVSDTNWNRYTVIFPADTTGAIDNDNTEGLRLTWHLLVGSDYTSGTMNTTWAATTNANIAAGQNANVGSSTSNNWYITGVQLEVGSVATEFEHRSFAEELALCQRYYFRFTTSVSGTHVAMGHQMTSSAAKIVLPFPTSMRTRPTAVETTGTASDYSVARTSTHEVCNVVPTFAGASKEVGNVNTNQTQASLSTGIAVVLRANTTAFFLGFSAEL